MPRAISPSEGYQTPLDLSHAIMKSYVKCLDIEAELK